MSPLGTASLLTSRLTGHVCSAQPRPSPWAGAPAAVTSSDDDSSDDGEGDAAEVELTPEEEEQVRAWRHFDTGVL